MNDHKTYKLDNCVLISDLCAYAKKEKEPPAYMSSDFIMLALSNWIEYLKKRDDSIGDGLISLDAEDLKKLGVESI